MNKKIICTLMLSSFWLISCENEYINGPGGVISKNDPTGLGCDTISVGFASHIKGILEEAECVTCHNASFTSGSVNLDGYDEAKSAVTNDNMQQAVNYENGYSNMPPGGKLTDCELHKINIWIKEGMKP